MLEWQVQLFWMIIQIPWDFSPGWEEHYQPEKSERQMKEYDSTISEISVIVEVEERMIEDFLISAEFPRASVEIEINDVGNIAMVQSRPEDFPHFPKSRMWMHITQVHKLVAGINRVQIF